MYSSKRKLITTAIFILWATMTFDAGAESRQVSAEREIMQIALCPKKLNCVSSLDQDSDRRIEPLRYDKSDTEALTLLRNIMEAMPRTEIVRSTSQYLRAEFKSAVFGFVDDVEMIVGDVPGVIHIRSASRVGYWDIGISV